MTIQLLYGSTWLSFDPPADVGVDEIIPMSVPASDHPADEVVRALETPVGRFSFQIFSPTGKAAIAINDKTRPVPNEYLLPPLLQKLADFGFGKSQVKFIVATGTHLALKSDELARLLQKSILNSYEVISHNCDDLNSLKYLGITSRATPVWINRSYLDADLRIAVGNIEPHHFAGFSGGVKTVAIGLAGKETITKNHQMLVSPDARIAEYELNPLRQDIEEIGKLARVDLAVNAILNQELRIVHVLAGSPLAVMESGIPLSRRICQVVVHKKYDVVIASVGGLPKDINFYQSQKALTHAAMITEDGGTVILVAACPEGTGSSSYEQFMEDVKNWDEVMEKFTRIGFQVGPHKAYQTARIGKRIHIVLVSSMPADLVKKLLLTPAASLADALKKASAFSTIHDIAVLPHATNTVPVFGVND